MSKKKEYCLLGKPAQGEHHDHWFDAASPERALVVAKEYAKSKKLQLLRVSRRIVGKKGKKDTYDTLWRLAAAV